MRIPVIIICAVDESLDWIAEILVLSIADAATPSAVLFLLRKYRRDALKDDRDDRDALMDDRDALKGGPYTAPSDIRDAIEAGLTHGLHAVVNSTDPRERCQWLGVFAEAAAISDDDRLVESVQRHLSPTIDGLERLARSEYEPG